MPHFIMNDLAEILALLTPPPKRTKYAGSAKPKPVDMHALTRHIPAPERAPNPNVYEADPSREGLFTICKDPKVKIKNGHPIGRLQVGKPLTDRRIAHYKNGGNPNEPCKATEQKRKRKRKGKNRKERRDESPDVLLRKLGL